jgi:hypothetical protein
MGLIAQIAYSCIIPVDAAYDNNITNSQNAM